ncbi:thioredoxin family protein [Streptococcus parauberis]|uniref:Putative redox-active disulfide protein 2 n=1 Tax=Streptococcus parauberis NCFD 2020 TaxID=873447 RepID=F1Z1M3_9STRE|nr:thioredoxin family protein [Streptococcus parauberis]EGE54720.1 putative redox-active disulfide protein 2 [Streptococcus parauberis NCFD 2020]
MGLFGNKEEKTCQCGNCKCGKVSQDNILEGSDHTFKVLGSGCKKCITLEENVKQACKEMNKLVNIKYVKDFSEIAAYGVMQTPALVLDEDVVSYGKVLTVDEVKEVIAENF